MKIKNLVLTILLAFVSIFTLSSCGGLEIEGNKNEISIIAPTGTPTLLLGKSIEEYGRIDTEIVSGPQALSAEFIKGKKDIIIAPINLGAKLASSTEDFQYVMFHTLVWCNYYIVSREEITSFEQFHQKDITIFGQNSTPDVIFRSLVKHHNIEPNVTYMASVADANKMLLANGADIILSAEPALSSVLQKGTFYVYSLADAWTKMAGFDGADVPQAAIFVNKASIEKTKTFLSLVEKNVKNVENEKEEVVAAAKRVDKLLVANESVLVNAISRCNFKIVENEQESINIYFQKVIDLGIGATVGGKLPDEEFYYQK